MSNIQRILIGFCFSIFLFACNSDDGMGDENTCQPNFNQEAFFTRIADDLILPGYEKLDVDLNALHTSSTTFVEQLNEVSLEDLKAKYTQAYKSWQVVAQYEFGPAKEVFLRNSLNNFPLNEESLLENVQTGIYDFEMPDRYDKGLPALDYLLYGIALDQNAILNKYIIGSNAEKYRQYLTAVTKDMVERTEQTLNEWKGTYRAKFIGNTGTAAGTSLSLLVNGLNENYELIKREKLGVPSGVLTLGIPNADRVEAFNSGLSTTLLQLALQATIDLFSIDNGLSFSDYLDAANARKEGNDLSQVILQQFTKATAAVNAFDAPINLIVESDKETVTNAYNEITRQLVNIKTDLPSVLCVSITYIDNPSDSD